MALSKFAVTICFVAPESSIKLIKLLFILGNSILFNALNARKAIFPLSELFEVLLKWLPLNLLF